MSIATLRERIRIQTPAHIPDQLGGYTLTWADRGEFWACVKPMGSNPEQLDGTKDLLPSRYRLQWRVGTHVPSTARIKWRGLKLRLLTAPEEDEHRRWVSAIAQVEGGHE